MNRAQLQAVASILKKRFNNLTVEELMDLACDIVDSVESAAEPTSATKKGGIGER